MSQDMRKTVLIGRPNQCDPFFSIQIQSEYFSFYCTYDLYGPVRNAFDAKFPGPNPLPLAQVMDAARIESIRTGP
jgi:hypothetical protein